jgi:hypothetical protein
VLFDIVTLSPAYIVLDDAAIDIVSWGFTATYVMPEPESPTSSVALAVIRFGDARSELLPKNVAVQEAPPKLATSDGFSNGPYVQAQA